MSTFLGIANVSDNFKTLALRFNETQAIARIEEFNSRRGAGFDEV